MLKYKQGRQMLFNLPLIIIVCGAIIAGSRHMYQDKYILLCVLALCVSLGVLACTQIVLAFYLLREADVPGVGAKK